MTAPSRADRSNEPNELQTSGTFEGVHCHGGQSGIIPTDVTKMQIEKIVLEKSAEALLDRAGDCFELAKTQHDLADKQHETATLQHENANKQQVMAAQQHSDADKLDAKADKLDTLGRALVDSAVEIKGETQLVQVGR